MIPFVAERKSGRRRPCGAVLGAVLLFLLFSHLPVQAAAKGPAQRAFPSPGEAVEALVAAVLSHDVLRMQAVLGPGSKAVVSSGDAAADREDREAFLEAYQERHRIEMAGEGRAILHVGRGDWPLPIPLVKQGRSWRFDTKTAREEILNRRIGRNELNVMQVCLAYVDAQREYALQDRDGDGLLEYAPKFASEPGQKDGLYWETADAEPPSPCGLLLCLAARQDAGKTRTPGQYEPYHGYFYKILTAQGAHAPGGAFDYVVNGDMIGGFALVAYPARYGNTGIVTFSVNHDGQLYEKNLGPKTAAIAEAMTRFDPDATWSKVEPPPVEPPSPSAGTP